MILRFGHRLVVRSHSEYVTNGGVTECAVMVWYGSEEVCGPLGLDRDRETCVVLRHDLPVPLGRSAMKSGDVP